MGIAAILVMWPGPFEQFSFPHLRKVLYELLTWIGLVVSEEKMFKEYVQQTDGRQTDDGGLPIP